VHHATVLSNETTLWLTLSHRASSLEWLSVSNELVHVLPPGLHTKTAMSVCKAIRGACQEVLVPLMASQACHKSDCLAMASLLAYLNPHMTTSNDMPQRSGTIDYHGCAIEQDSHATRRFDCLLVDDIDSRRGLALSFKLAYHNVAPCLQAHKMRIDCRTSSTSRLLARTSQGSLQGGLYSQ
jgi:hypothetical protein